MFKRNGSALRQLLILQRNYLRLYLIETFLSGQVIIHYLLNCHSSNLSKPNTSPYKMCIEPQYKSNTRRHTRKDSSNSYSEKEVFYGRLHKQKANGAHSRIRTEDLRFTRPLLWPTELSEHITGIDLNMRPYSIALNRLFTHLLVLLQCRPFGLARKPRLELRTQQSKCCVIPFHHFRMFIYK